MILLGDCIERLKELEANSVDAVVTDPPYGWRFMGKAWDGADIERVAKNKERGGVMADGRERKPRDIPAESAGTYNQSLEGNHAFQTFSELYAKELYRVLKPGGHMLVFCGPRTYHRMASGVEDAGFEIRDQLQWLFGSGFPKSHNLGNGTGSALKPANEPIVLARKPLSEKTLAKNMLKWGVGGLNIDISRVKTDGDSGQHTQGRWPANLLLDEEAAEMLDEQSGDIRSRNGYIDQGQTGGGSGNAYVMTKSSIEKSQKVVRKDQNGYLGGASRFFYCAKSSKAERNAGLEGMPEKICTSYSSAESRVGKVRSDGVVQSAAATPKANHHPTVKPLKLMEYLIKLITPPEGVVLDPFMGSGSTGVAAFKNGFKFIGIEMNEEYLEIAKRRIEHAKEISS